MSGIIGGAGSRSGVIIPDGIGCRLQPNSSSTFTMPNGNEHWIGWTTNNGLKGCFINGLTLSGQSGTDFHDGNANGRITFNYSGVYWINFDLRNENSASNGNPTMYIDGTLVQRQHVEGWAQHPYMHGQLRGCFNLNAGQYLYIGVGCNGGQFQGYADTLNYLQIMRQN